jgi:hypothetical protein
MIDFIVKYMTDNGQTVFTGNDELNIVYLEGIDFDFKLNDDAFNKWNDLRVVFKYVDGCPELLFRQVCTTEPGKMSTFSLDARKRKGVARIAFGQYTAWKMGFHKQSTNAKNHPALVQCNPIPVHRDLNMDGKRIGDIIYTGLFGINQHGTKIGYHDEIKSTVENWSEGCLVGKDWNKHIEFINLLKTDSRYLKDNNFIFTTSIIPADELKV